MSSNSSNVESSTGGKIAQVPYGTPLPSFTSQLPEVVPQPPRIVPYFPGQNFGYGTGFVGNNNIDSGSGQLPGATQYHGGQ